MTTLPNPPASVLVAEDDEHISHLLNFMLTREKYTVHLARDGREAKQFIENNAPPSIVLMDVMLPFSDGFVLLGILREQASWKATPRHHADSQDARAGHCQGAQCGRQRLCTQAIPAG